MEALDRLARSGMDNGLDGDEEKELDEDSSGDGLESLVEAIETRVGEAQGEEMPEWRQRERKGRLEGEEELGSTAVANQVGEDADMSAPAKISYGWFGLSGIQRKATELMKIAEGGDGSGSCGLLDTTQW